MKKQFVRAIVITAVCAAIALSAAYAGPQDYVFGADHAAISWLEQNGYDVTYISGADTDRLGASSLEQHKAFISVGHDEYWSGDQRANVEAARDAGVNLLFWSGNEVYWKTRWEGSIVDGVDHRTLVSYKETKFNYSLTAGPQDYANVDPSNQWTGTWRDLRFVDAVGPDGVTHTAVGAKPENALTGQLFGADGTGQFGGAIDVPAAYAGLRVWRDTGVGPGGATGIAPGILGYEWDSSPSDAFRPAGLIKLSESTLAWNDIVTDQGNRESPGVATHDLTLYRAPSGALVFGAGTVFWSWGLSNEHDSSPYGANIASKALQQFSVNMFADMGIQPAVADAILQSQGLVRALASNDHIAATTTLNNLPASVSALSQITISGAAADIDNNPANDDGRVAIVEVSLDGGQTWNLAQGTANWTYSWTPTAQGSYTIEARAIDDSLNILPNNQLATDIVTVTAPVRPSTFSLFGSSVTPTGTLTDDGAGVELGTKFTSNTAGAITALRYFRATGDASDTDTRQGHLWASDGTLLATVTFTSGPNQSGWQVASLNAPVAIQAGATYVVSYHTADNYLATDSYFTTTFTEPFGVLSAPASSTAGGNGVFAYGASALFPDQNFQAENYWVDVVFAPAGGANGAPSTPDLAAASDSGSSSTDNLTNDNTPTLVGTAVAGATVNLSDGATQVGTATADAGGGWSITTAALTDGSHVLTATAVTANGASPASGPLTVNIDTSPPAAPTTPDMTAASDDGVSNTDNATSIATPTFVGTLANEPGAVVTLSEGAVTLGSATVDSAGNWSITSTALSVGNHALTARATDVAGNLGALSGALPVSILPGAAPSQFSLFGPSVTPTGQVFDDGQAVELGVKFTSSTAGAITALRYFRATGDASDTDLRAGHLWSSTGTLLGTVTFNSVPGQSGWQTATLNSPVAIQAGATYVVSYNTADNYLATGSYFTSAFTEPNGVLSAPASGTAGGNGVYAYGASGLFPTQSFQASNYWVDVVFVRPNGAPAAPSTPDLAAASDSGSSSTDNLTNDNTPTLVGTAVAGATVNLSDGATQVGTATADAGGAWSITTAALADGSHLLTATAVTANGASPASGPLTVNIDTSPPVAPTTPDMTAASDDGVSNTDNATSIATPTFVGTLANEPGAVVTLSEGAVTLGSATVDSAGNWSITSTALSVGNHALTARATDVAGNLGALSGALPVSVVSPAVAAPSTPDLAAASDSGSSSTDNLTNDNTPTLVGTAVAGATVNLSDGATQVGTATADAGGAWSITTAALTDGSHVLTATAVTANGASPASGPLTVNIDTSPPAAPTTPDMTAASDDGVSNTDNATSIATPTFVGTLANEAGAVVTLSEGAVTLGSATVDSAGNWSITSTALSVGNHALTARATDVAGNLGALSGALAVSIVSPAVAAPSTPDLAAASDSGSSSTDNLTNDNTPTLVGTAVAGATVNLSDSATQVGTATADAGGAWSITTAALTDGSHVLTATAVTANGASPASGPLTVNIDTSPPAAPTTPDMTAASDDGVSNTDNATSIATPTFVGTLANEAGAVVTLSEGAVTLGSATVASAGNWSITSTALSVGSHALTARATDVAGNLGALSGALAVSIVSPAGQTITGTSSANTLNGGSGNDSISGLGGADQLFGNAGNDTLDGGAGTDTLNGGAGNDVLLISGSQAQSDTMIGGDGTDTLRVSAAGGAVTLGDTRAISTIEVFDGSGQAVQGNGSANLLDFSGFTSVVGVVSISGLGGADTLIGTSGADVLIGGAGADRLTGGAGDDVFRYLAFNESSSSARDVIQDFAGAGVAGGDLIDVSALSPSTFAFNGTGAFSGGGVPSIRYVVSGGVTDVMFDSGNGGTAEMVVRINGVVTLFSGDFIL